MNENAHDFLMHFEPVPPDILNTSSKSVIKVPFTEIAALGASFMPMIKKFRTITQTINIDSSDLYKAVDANGNPVKLTYRFKDGSGYSNMTKKGIARLQEVKDIQGKIQTTIPFDPTTLLIAAVLIGIDKKLDDIKELQQNMYDFLQEDKHSKIKGNLIFLMDIFKNYRFNSDNNIYKKSAHIKIMDIKQESIQNILFYRSQIEKCLEKDCLLISDNDINKQVEKNISDFRFYKLSLYCFAFSSFIEIMLLDNYKHEYLNEVSESISQHSIDFLKIYTDYFNKIKNDTKKLISSHITKGLGDVAKGVGNIIAKSPVGNKTLIDEKLTDLGGKLQKSVRSKSDSVALQLTAVKGNCISPFIENIKLVDKIYNSEYSLYCDNENLYFESLV